jgi:Cu+-exporting ATPase
VSLCFWAPLMVLAMSNMLFDRFNWAVPEFWRNSFYGAENAEVFALAQVLLLIPVIVANKKYFTGGFRAAVKLSPNMDTLVALGAGAAMLYGVFALFAIGYGLGRGDMTAAEKYGRDLYFESAGTILTLITVGKYLETRSKGRTGEAITKLMKLAPRTVNLIRDGKEITVNADEVAVGDIFSLKPGEAAAVDGIITEGVSSFDESAVTGESIPAEKKVGDKIVSATINKNGYVVARATKVGKDTTIAQIIKLVEEASASKAPIAKLADKISGVFVPAVLGIALIAFIAWLSAGYAFEFAMARGIAVLVISCPCALGLATPVAIMVGTGKGAENGILIKSGEALQNMGSVNTVVFDKTGTVTEGKPSVTDISVYGVEKTYALRIAAGIEKMSGHPLAEAVGKKCADMDAEPFPAVEFSAVFGKGVTAIIGGAKCAAGNLLFAEELGADTDSARADYEKYAGDGKTPLAVVENGKIIAVIAAADRIKPDARETVAKLKKSGVSVVLLTGDNLLTARAVGAEIGADDVRAGVLPDGKAAAVKELKADGRKVAMVGDGINDAPALAAADAGIAVGAGTDIAIESADAVLMKSDLASVPDALKLGRAVMRNIKENLFWAFFYNIVGIPIAAGALYAPFGIALNPMIGAAAMSLSSVCVVTNALRLRTLNFQKENKKTKREKCNMEKTVFIEGMMCAHCVKTVKKALENIDGVKKADVSLEEKRAVVTLKKDVDKRILDDAVIKAGYKVNN